MPSSVRVKITSLLAELVGILVGEEDGDEDREEDKEKSRGRKGRNHSLSISSCAFLIRC